MKLNLPAGTSPDLIVSNFAVTIGHRTDLACPHCDGSMPLVRRIDLNLKEIPEIYIFYCSRCQHAETVKHERTACELSERESVDAD